MKWGKFKIKNRKWLIKNRQGRDFLAKAFFLLALGAGTIGVALINGRVTEAAANITSTVYIDYNGNGIRDNIGGASANLAIDRGLSGVTVTAFATDGTICDSQATDGNGNYTLNMSSCSGTTFRIEFSNIPAGYQPTQNGSTNGTTTQFVNEGGTANLGVSMPGNYCQNNPMLAANCYRLGAYDDPSVVNYQTLQGFPYNATGDTPTPLQMGTIGEVGTTYGIAYRKADKSVYSAAFMKRHAGFGPGGPGAIYASAPVPAGSGSVSSSLFVTIPNAGTDPHPVSSTNCDSIDGQTGGTSVGGFCWVYDQFSYTEVSKRGLGDMDIYEDPTTTANDALFAVNLNDKQLYKVTALDGTPTPTGYPVPLALPGAAQGCALTDTRPFAVSFHNGTGYIGINCTAQSTSNAANLRAYVYSFNPTTMVFSSSPTLEFPLNYPRTCVNHCPVWASPADGSPDAPWKPWSDTWDPTGLFRGYDFGNNETFISYAQPILSDITFGDDGSMSLGIRDRFGDQAGYKAGPPTVNDPDLFSSSGAGDTLRACLVGSTWQLESGGTCNGQGPGPAGTISHLPAGQQGPGGSEFYNHEYHANVDGSLNFEEEVSLGSLAQVPGFPQIASTLYDPLHLGDDGAWDGGVRRMDTRTGDEGGSYLLYESFGTGEIFGKANGLGDIEVLCDTAPLEVGNRLWNDTNANGVQDPGETPIAGVTVHLYNAASTLIGTTVTDTNGNYYFSNRATDANGNPMSDSTGKDYGVTGLLPNAADYTIKLDHAADYTNPSLLQGLRLSPQNATVDNGNDQNDSDASIGAGSPSAANPPTITFDTLASGFNNHTYDIGLAPAVSLGNFVWNDTNNNGFVDGSEATQGFNGVAVNLYDNSADTNGDGQLSATEIAAATPIATTTTANDARPGPTNGRPGYYSFTGLDSGKYFVQIAPSNFVVSSPLFSYFNSPVPPGVGDTHSDNKNHGGIPSGGTLIANGVVSVAIDVQAGSEPTTISGDPDDDGDPNSDMTIDFSFWHPFSLGNRVWYDLDNSATINAADGPTPGAPGVTVNLLNGSGTFITSTTTDATGYYRFDGLNAGSYIVEIPASNFGAGQPLENFRLSSIAPAESNNPMDGVDNNDDGINPPGVAMAVRSGVDILGPNGTEPLNELDLSASGQGTQDAWADMTVDFGFVQPPYKGDTVYFDVDGDGTQDANEPGIPNVTVRLTDTATTNLIATAVTNSQGKYLFSDFAPGTYTVTVDTSTVPGGNATTPTVINNPTMQSGDAILTDDFGFNGDGTLGNQVWIDENNNGTFDPGEPGVQGVTIDLYDDLNNNGVIESGEPVIKTTTTDTNGQYQFSDLLTDDNNPTQAGAQYIVRVTDTAGKLNNFSHIAGPNPGANNNSQDPDGYAMILTPAASSNQTGDFGYITNPNLVDPPRFTKVYTVDGDVLRWTLVWINQSNISNVLAHIEDAIPAGTMYVGGTLACSAQGSSSTTNCAYDSAANKVVWDGYVGADAGHIDEASAVNEIIMTFDTRLDPATTDVTNQAQCHYDQNGDGVIDGNDGNVANPDLCKSDDPTVGGSADPNYYSRSPLATTGQAVIGGVIAALALIAAAVVIYVRMYLRRNSPLVPHK